MLKTFSMLSLIEAAAMLPSLFVALHYGQGDAAPIGACILFIMIPGSIIFFLSKPKAATLRVKEGFFIVAFGWILLSVFGALPFIVSGIIPNFADALFEAVSGFTTTGATVVSDYDNFPKGLMIWRASTHWIGGMGVLVLTLALLPKLTGHSAHLIRAESPGPSLSKLVPQMGNTAKILYIIYFILTLTEVIALLLCGLSPYDAILHSLSTAGTGGFSNYGDSVAAFGNVSAEIVITVFMFLFGVNFAMYFRLSKGDFKGVLHDEEFRWYFYIVLGFILLISVINLSFYPDFGTSLRYGSFQVCSILSTTGFATCNFDLWPVASKMLIVAALFIGSCAGSTAGGIKVIRAVILGKVIKRQIVSTVKPKKVQVIRLNGETVEDSMVSQVIVFAVAYFVLLIIGSILLSLENKNDVITHFTAALTCLSNVGPGLSGVGPATNFADYSNFSKCVCSFLMLSGRLELFPMFILFIPSVWHSRSHSSQTADLLP